MRLKVFLLAAVAALAIGMPARADLVYEFRLAPDQVDPEDLNGPSGGTPFAAGALQTTSSGSPLLLNPNQDYIIQIALQQINTTAGTPFFVNSTNNRMAGYGFRVGYVPGVFFHVNPVGNFGNGGTPLPPGDVNTATTLAGGFSGAPVLNGTNATSTAIRDVTTGAGYFANNVPAGNLNIYTLANLRFHTGSSGSGRLTITDPGTGDDNGSGNNSTMDPGIFDVPLTGGVAGDGNANGFELFFQINAIPEPSSMVLCGLGLAGLGARLRRKKVAKQETAA